MELQQSSIVGDKPRNPITTLFLGFKIFYTNSFKKAFFIFLLGSIVYGILAVGVLQQGPGFLTRDGAVASEQSTETLTMQESSDDKSGKEQEAESELMDLKSIVEQLGIDIDAKKTGDASTQGEAVDKNFNQDEEEAYYSASILPHLNTFSVIMLVYFSISLIYFYGTLRIHEGVMNIQNTHGQTFRYLLRKVIPAIILMFMLLILLFVPAVLIMLFMVGSTVMKVALICWIILAVLFSYIYMPNVLFELLLENKGIFSSIRDGISLVWGNFWYAFLSILALTIIAMVLGGIIGGAIGFVNAIVPAETAIMLRWVFLLLFYVGIYGVIYMFKLSCWLAVYYTLKQRKSYI